MLKEQDRLNKTSSVPGSRYNEKNGEKESSRKFELENSFKFELRITGNLRGRDTKSFEFNE